MEVIYLQFIHDTGKVVLDEKENSDRRIMKGFFLRTFARKFSNIDFFLKILPLKDDELVMSEM